MNSDPESEEYSHEIVQELIACLAQLADAGLPAEMSEIAQEAQQKAELLSHQIDAERDRLTQELLHARQERNDFISVVTHELRLPMTSIKGYTDLLRQGAVGQVNDQQLNFLDIIRSNVDRMAALLSDLSDISRVDTGRMKLEISALDIEQPLESALKSQQPAWEKKGISVEVDLPADLQQVAADPDRLVQVITNLLRNAIMYTPKGGRVWIRAFQEGDQLRLEIADSGIGVKPEDQTRLFTPFFRSDDAYVRDQPGWGISLYVTSKLIRVMQGSIGMVGDHETGSVFWFSLPLKRSS